MISANTAVFFDIEAVFKGFFVFMAAVADSLTALALHFDGIILAHSLEINRVKYRGKSRKRQEQRGRKWGVYT